MSSEFGNKLKITVFGQSHGEAVGVVADGFPAGENIDTDELCSFMDRRRGGKNALSTARSEADIPRFISGVENGITVASPLCAIIDNRNVRSADYALLADTPRPGHADLTAFLKWSGKADMRGGGHFSGRLTAPLCAAGGIAKQILARRGIFVGAHISEIAGIADKSFPLLPDVTLFEQIAAKDLPVIDDSAGEKMCAAVLGAAKDGDSVGGIIECAAVGLSPGLGEPMFGGVENRLAAVLFGIPAVKGVEFGSGFAGSRMRGSENNDGYSAENGKIRINSNNCGGILGGITNGMPLVFRTAIKPTPSIAREQDSISLSEMKSTKLSIRGRHDPCIAQRAVPVVEAVAALVLLDMILEDNQHGHQ